MNDVNNIEILLVEDNPADARLIIEVFDQFEKANLTIARDGIEAMDYLNKKGKYKDRDFPSIIILDLNLPKTSGKEILRKIKHDEKLKRVPVIILTTSCDDNDINSSYGNYASAYLTKPTNFDEFNGLMQSLQNFWFKWVTLPKYAD